MKTITRTTVLATAAVAAFTLLAGCSTAPPRPTTAAVGPVGASGQPGGIKGRGTLMVYTAEEPITDGDVNYFPHTAYGLFAADGEFIRMIPNRVGNRDETPMVVRLDVGTYLVQGLAEGMGRVTVPTVIGRNQMTVINLKRQGLAEGDLLRASDRVELADGRVIGRRAPVQTTTSTQ